MGFIQGILTGRTSEPKLDTTTHVSDEIRQTTCYMCACRCGINVHLREGKVSYIEGNNKHPVNKGVLCAKGSAGIMQHYSPARLRKPLKRVGERGDGQFEEIEWEEAISIAVSWLSEIRKTDPKKLAFFTGRDQSQSLTSWWSQQFGTPNYAAHGGFCSVNMAAAGIYTMGGSFWEFGTPDWDRTKMLLLFGVAEDHDSNPIKTGLSKIKEHGGKIVGINPVRSGYNAIADEWIGIKPGTDGLFVLSIIHELLRTGHVDLEYLIRYTNAACLVLQMPGQSTDGLLARNADGDMLVWDRVAGREVPVNELESNHALRGIFTLRDGRRVRPVFQLMCEKYLSVSYAPVNVAERCGVPAETIKRIAAELAHTAFNEEIEIEQPWTDWLGRYHQKMIGRPVSFHAMRGISAHSNGFQTCRAIHLLQIILGTVEVPGGFRFKPPYPKPFEAHPTPHCISEADCPLNGPHLGFPRGPEDLALDENGEPARIDKAFSWDAPLSAHGMMHMVIANAANKDPYEIDLLFMYMANMSWNSSMNSSAVMDMLRARGPDGRYLIPKIIYSDAYSSEMVAFADLVLPDTTYLERFDCISLLDRPISDPDEVADSLRWPVVSSDRDVRGFQSVLIELGNRLKLPGFVDINGVPKYKDYSAYMVYHERREGVGPLAGFRGANGKNSGRGEPNPIQLAQYVENGGFWSEELPDNSKFFKPWNKNYQEWAVEKGFFDSPQPYLFNLYCEPLRKFQLAAEGHGEIQPPERLRSLIQEVFSPFPIWYAPFTSELLGEDEFPIHAITQRPAAMYHSWGSQNAWLRQIHGENPLYVSGDLCDHYDLKDGDWVWLISFHNRIKCPIVRMDSVSRNTVWTWNAIGKRSGAWALEPNAPEFKKGFLLNHLIHELLPVQNDGYRWSNSDPITGQAAWYDLKVKIEKTEPSDQQSIPQFEAQSSPVGLAVGIDSIAYGEEWTR